MIGNVLFTLGALVTVAALVDRLYKGPCCERHERKNRIVDFILVMGGTLVALDLGMAHQWFLLACIAIIGITAVFDVYLVNAYLDSLQLKKEESCRRAKSL